MATGSRANEPGIRTKTLPISVKIGACVDYVSFRPHPGIYGTADGLNRDYRR